REDCSVGGQLRARVRVGGLVPDQSAPLGRRPDRVHVTQLGVSQQRVLLDQYFEPVALEQERDRLHVVVLIHLDDRLSDLGPIFGIESAQHIELALLHVDLEQVDALDAFLRNDARERSQPTIRRSEARRLANTVNSPMLAPTSTMQSPSRIVMPCRRYACWTKISL